METNLETLKKLSSIFYKAFSEASDVNCHIGEIISALAVNTNEFLTFVSQETKTPQQLILSTYISMLISVSNINNNDTEGKATGVETSDRTDETD